MPCISASAEIYDLDILFESVEDDEHNTTRFLLMASQPSNPERGNRMITTLVFQLRSVPAALYKSLGGFATNGINMTKLESYIRAGVSEQAQFYVDVEAHIDDPPMQNALEELRFYCTKDEVHVLELTSKPCVINSYYHQPNLTQKTCPNRCFVSYR